VTLGGVGRLSIFDGHQNVVIRRTKPHRNLTVFNSFPVFLDASIKGFWELRQIPLSGKSDSREFHPGWFTVAENHHSNTNTTTTTDTRPLFDNGISMITSCLLCWRLAAHLLQRLMRFGTDRARRRVQNALSRTPDSIRRGLDLSAQCARPGLWGPGLPGSVLRESGISRPVLPRPGIL
jgi:hypothetical protein